MGYGVTLPLAPAVVRADRAAALLLSSALPQRAAGTGPEWYPSEPRWPHSTSPRLEDLRGLQRGPVQRFLLPPTQPIMWTTRPGRLGSRLKDRSS